MAGFTLVLEKNKSILYRAIGKFVRIFRNIKRKRIASKVLALKPSPLPSESVPFSIHMLVCKHDVKMSICSAKSLNLACQQVFTWIFHDDGSLHEKDYQLLSYHFPGCTILTRSYTDQHVASLHAKYPLTFQMRDRYKMMLKLVDLALFSGKERILYIDSDILFFNNPLQIKKEIYIQNSANFFNKDIKSSYLYTPQELTQFTGINMPERVNAGLSLLHTSILDLDKIENLLRKIPLSPSLIYHRIEQTLVGLLAASSPYGVKYLDKDYDVCLDKDITNAVCKHYVGVIRHNFELEGLTYLLNEHDFVNRWNAFVLSKK